MAKRKPSDPETTVPADDATSGAENEAAATLGQLAEEVQGFLAKRDELAQKLVAEITATERRLAELKRTAALLFPDGGLSPAGANEKPERKVKKTHGKPGKSFAESSNDNRPLLDDVAPPADFQPAANGETNGAAHANDGATGEQG